MQQLKSLCTVFVLLTRVLCSIQNCIGYAKNGKCKECLPGYIGEHCSHTCRYPSYGKGCQHVCKCNPTVCHIASGCSQSIECRPGYFGLNCVHKCRYPSYGVNCQLFCLCEEQFCDRKTGCQSFSKCPLGYMGINCSMSCRYPSYGMSCQNVCRCSEEYCDISSGCMEKTEETTYPTKETRAELKSEQPTNENPEADSETTPILIGAVVALCLILLAVAVRVIWKNMKNSYLKIRRGVSNMSNLQAELKRKTCEYEDLKENLYEELDEKESDDTKNKKKEVNSENDYIDTLNFKKKENRGDDRESKHFYDGLK